MCHWNQMATRIPESLEKSWNHLLFNLLAMRGGIEDFVSSETIIRSKSEYN